MHWRNAAPTRAYIIPSAAEWKARYQPEWARTTVLFGRRHGARAAYGAWSHRFVRKTIEFSTWKATEIRGLPRQDGRGCHVEL